MRKTAATTGIWIHGSSGRMGKEIQRLIVEQHPDLRLAGGSSRHFEGEHFHQGRPVTSELLAQSLAQGEIDVVLDFSGVEGNETLIAALATGKASGKAVLVGTTGLSDQQLARWRELADHQKLKLLIAPNTSLGILLTVKAALLAAVPLAGAGFDIEITETHHRAKKDAPSGTARFIADTLAAGVPGLHVTTERQGPRQPGEIGVHAVRGGGVIGEHEVRLIGDNEEITISHRAFSRSLFAAGALVLATWLVRQKPGCYGLLDVAPGDLAT